MDKGITNTCDTAIIASECQPSMEGKDKSTLLAWVIHESRAGIHE